MTDWDADHLADAIAAAVLIHMDQRDKGDQPYAWHVLRVGLGLLPDIDAAIVGVLHDSIEDQGNRITIGEIEKRFGHMIAVAVALLSRDKSVAYGDYIAALKGNALARKVKLSDLRDNLREDRLALARAKGHDVTGLVARYKAAIAALEEAQ